MLTCRKLAGRASMNATTRMQVSFLRHLAHSDLCALHVLADDSRVWSEAGPPSFSRALQLSESKPSIFGANRSWVLKRLRDCSKLRRVSEERRPEAETLHE